MAAILFTSLPLCPRHHRCPLSYRLHYFVKLQIINTSFLALRVHVHTLRDHARATLIGLWGVVAWCVARWIALGTHVSEIKGTANLAGASGMAIFICAALLLGVHPLPARWFGALVFARVSMILGLPLV